MSRAPQLQAGDTFGPYTLVNQIAVGGMAEIYLAKASGISGFEKFVALKVIHSNYSADQQFIEMLIEEAKISVHLTQPNIVQIFDLGRIGETYYIAMEYVDGPDLYHIMRTITEVGEEVDFDVAAYIAMEICAALDYAHRCRDQLGQPLNIIHRDISPQNILISRAGEVKLADFGIAKATLRARHTAVGIIKGKYYYMSPEQAWGDPIDHRTDIFSAGVVLYEIIVGQMLYLEEDLGKLLDRVRKAEIAVPQTLRANVPPALQQIVMTALARRPEDRFPTANDFQLALANFLFKYSPGFTSQRVQRLILRATALEEQKRTRDAVGPDFGLATSDLAPEDLMSVHEYKSLSDHSLLEFEEPTRNLGAMESLPGFDEYDDEETLIDNAAAAGPRPTAGRGPDIPFVISDPRGPRGAVFRSDQASGVAERPMFPSNVSTDDWDEAGGPTDVQAQRSGSAPVFDRRRASAGPPIHSPPGPGLRVDSSDEMTLPSGPRGLRARPEPPSLPVARGAPQAVPPLPPTPRAAAPLPPTRDPGFGTPVFTPGISPAEPADADLLGDEERFLVQARRRRTWILLGVIVALLIVGVAVFVITVRSMTTSPGTVTVESIPRGAKVFYRDKPVGVTPHRFERLSPDEVHTIRLEKVGCESKIIRLEVAPGKEKSIVVKLDNCE